MLTATRLRQLSLGSLTDVDLSALAGLSCLEALSLAAVQLGPAAGLGLPPSLCRLRLVAGAGSLSQLQSALLRAPQLAAHLTSLLVVSVPSFGGVLPSAVANLRALRHFGWLVPTAADLITATLPGCFVLPSVSWMAVPARALTPTRLASIGTRLQRVTLFGFEVIGAQQQAAILAWAAQQPLLTQLSLPDTRSLEMPTVLALTEAIRRAPHLQIDTSADLLTE